MNLIMIRSFFISLIIFFTIITNSFSRIIQNVEILGNKRILDETILVLANIKLGQNFEDKEMNRIFKDLYDSNFFESIEFFFENDLLTIKVKENPIIENIQLEGIKNKSILELIKNNMVLKNRMSFSDNIFKKDLEKIKNILSVNGYYFSKITPRYNFNEEFNSADIVIDIILGEKAKIKKISFIGDKIIKDKELLDVITSEEHKFWKLISNRVYLDETRINLDTRLLENYYKNLGYYNVKIINRFAEITKKDNFNLIFNINAGHKFYFEDFKLNIPDDYNEKDFSKILKTFNKNQGKEYSLDTINDILIDIEDIASSKMYEFITANVEENIDDNKISFTFNLKDSENIYVDKINILGNFNTLEEVIRNKLIVDEGDPLNMILFNKSIDNIKSTGYFKKVNTDIRNSSSPNLKIIDIEVEEQPTGQISLGAGYGSTGSSIGGGISEKNFLGKGINLVTNLELSEDAVKGEFSYIKSNFNYSDNALKTSLKSQTSDFLTDYGYKLSTIGFSLGTEFEQFDRLSLSPELEFSLDDLETNSKASASLNKQEGSYQDFYFNYGLNLDRRNSTFRPTNGDNFSFYQTLPLISDNSEISNTFIYTTYAPLNKNREMIGKASLYFKTVNTFNDNDVRISKRIQLPYSRLRGFEKGKIGPKDNNDFVGGNYATSINLSTNLPFLFRTLENFEFSYFLDVGNVWGVDYNKSLDDSNFIRSSTGLGLDFLTPIGPLSFSLTQPITKKTSDKTESFRFNLGTTF